MRASSSWLSIWTATARRVFINSALSLGGISKASAVCLMPASSHRAELRFSASTLPRCRNTYAIWSASETLPVFPWPSIWTATAHRMFTSRSLELGASCRVSANRLMRASSRIAAVLPPGDAPSALFGDLPCCAGSSIRSVLESSRGCR